MSSTQTQAARPVPFPDDVTEGFWDSARRHQLAIQRCASCARFNHAPSRACPACGSEDLRYVPVSGRGQIYSYTVISDPPGPGFRDLVPFVVGVVELAEQPRLLMVTNLVGIDPAQLRIGLDVEVTFEDITDDCALPQFRVAGGGAR